MWCRLASAHRRPKGCALNIYFVHTKDALILKCFGRSIASRFHLKNCGSIAPKRVANSLSKRTPFFFFLLSLTFSNGLVCVSYSWSLLCCLFLWTHMYFFPLLSNDTRPLCTVPHVYSVTEIYRPTNSSSSLRAICEHVSCRVNACGHTWRCICCMLFWYVRTLYIYIQGDTQEAYTFAERLGVSFPDRAWWVKASFVWTRFILDSIVCVNAAPLKTMGERRRRSQKKSKSNSTTIGNR